MRSARYVPGTEALAKAAHLAQIVCNLDDFVEQRLATKKEKRKWRNTRQRSHGKNRHRPIR